MNHAVFSKNCDPVAELRSGAVIFQGVNWLAKASPEKQGIKEPCYDSPSEVSPNSVEITSVPVRLQMLRLSRPCGDNQLGQFRFLYMRRILTSSSATPRGFVVLLTCDLRMLPGEPCFASRWKDGRSNCLWAEHLGVPA